jgi:DNA invertase Pin-like site-specific DNA recombinase
MRLIGYVRTSASNANGDSLEAQRDAIREWCGREGHELAAVYVDDGRSGALAAEEREGLAAALTAIERDPAVEGLVVHRVDRLARELHVQEAVLARVWRTGGAVFEAVHGEILRDDPSDPYRTFVRQVAGAAAQLERGLVTARLQGGRRRARAQGRYAGGRRPPYGWRLADDGKALERDGEEQKVIRRIARLKRRGHTLRSITDRLERDGVPAPGGGLRWSTSTIKTILERVARV